MISTEVKNDIGQIRVVIFEEDKSWVAQCLEYDIGAQASDIQTLEHYLSLTLKLELEESLRVTGKPFGGIDPAPKQYHDMWDKFSNNQLVPNDAGEHNLKRALCA